MAEVTQPGPVPENACIREAVCIHTKKILDSCLDKDCVEDLRVYLTRDSQNCLDRATSVKARSAELLYVSIDVESVPFNNGFYTIELTFYYKILADAIIGALRPTTVYGLSVFSKRVMLFGSESSAKVFTSLVNPDGVDKQMMMRCNVPQAVVEVVEPMLLAAKLVDTGDSRRCDNEVAQIPTIICQCFDDELVTGGDGRRLYVTLGQFSIIRLERDTQLLMPAFDYCVPTKTCCDSDGEEEDPCDIFGKIKFPVNEFFPGACTNTCSTATKTTNHDCCNKKSC
jgi:hypothetical protein